MGLREDERALGLPPNAEVNLDMFMALVHPEDLERVRGVIAEAMQSGAESAVEYRIQHSDGAVRWISSRGRRQAAGEGEADQLMGVSIDITEITRLRERLQAESDYLKDEIEVHGRFTEIIGQSKSLRKVFERIEQVAPTDSTVLITGETGTGKELVARAIHSLSRRKDRVMVKVDCSALPATLIESELFGREKGVPPLSFLQPWRHFNIKSTLAFPLYTGGGEVFGVLGFGAVRHEREWPKEWRIRVGDYRIVYEIDDHARTVDVTHNWTQARSLRVVVVRESLGAVQLLEPNP
jgi:PAS domain S-box-containing protein